MSTYKTQGIILKKKNFGETDKILTVYSEKRGKVNLIAKGVRKVLSKLAGHLELFYLSDFFIAEGKKLDTLVGAQIINNFPSIHLSTSKIKYVYYIVEIIDRLIKTDEKSPEIYNLLLKTIITLEESKINDELVLIYFQAQLLALLGHKPEMEYCLKCQKKLNPEINYFSYSLGGIICEDCHKYDIHSQLVSTKAIKLARLILDKNNLINIKSINSETRELQKILKNFIEWIGERRIQSAKYL